ncbi:MAG: HAMP domain-containing protein [Desulfuromonadaceae bacterium]|nr:HAMP domain-containing protein [Desulfuromonadaceae bacterium]
MNLHRKLLMAFLLLSFCPLFLLVLSSNNSLESVEELVRRETTLALDTQASKALLLRAESTADQVGSFLGSVVNDVRTLAYLPADEAHYRQFYQTHQREIWTVDPHRSDDPQGARFNVPLYVEIALIDSQGVEQLRLLNGEPASLRDVSQPQFTTYRCENYFQQSRLVGPDDVYISPLFGWHVSREQQLAGQRYEGLIRFCCPLSNEEGAFAGLVMLALDHCHLMEFTRHISSGEPPRVLEASYAEANYAFIFDPDGWILTHPKHWDIRGLDAQGRLVPAYTGGEDDGRKAYNLLVADLIHKNYPHVAREVLAGRAGIADVTNVGGAEKLMAYAPIHIDGLSLPWGGVTLGAQKASFHRAALATSSDIRQRFRRHWQQSGSVIVFSLILIVIVAQRISTGITRPLSQLIEGTRHLSHSGAARFLPTPSGQDEVAMLTEAFNTMVHQLQVRRARQSTSLLELRRSRQQILRERNFTQTVVEHIETGILTLDEQGQVTAMMGPARTILLVAPSQELPMPLSQALACCPEMAAAVIRVLQEGKEAGWSQYFECPREGRIMTLRLALLPFGVQKKSLMLSVEDLTERAQMRVRMARMERLASLGRLSAGMAHEIRNPLTGISLLLDDLHDRLLNQPTDQLLIRRALDELERLEGLVNDLLNFARVPESHKVPSSLAEALRRAVRLFEQNCRKAGVELQLELDRDVPELLLDESRLQQAFLNLLRNALEAMPDGGTLRISLSADADAACVRICDSGVGMTREQQALIFEPFYTCKEEGNGLGLSIVHNILSEHGARIEVHSEAGAGSCFELYFPFQPA